MVSILYRIRPSFVALSWPGIGSESDPIPDDARRSRLPAVSVEGTKWLLSPAFTGTCPRGVRSQMTGECTDQWLPEGRGEWVKAVRR